MELKVREIKSKDIYLRDALKLVKNVFDEFEAPYYSEEGVITFYKFIEYDNINKMLDDNLEMYALLEFGRVVGVIAFRDKSHITLLFVDKKYHKQGVGSRLLYIMREKCMRSVYTVNSSPYAVEFYEKRGFEKVSEEQLKDGIRFTPMKQEIKLL